MTATVTTSGSTVKSALLKLYLINQSVDFHQTPIDTLSLGGGGGELIWRLWQYFQGHNSTL